MSLKFKGPKVTSAKQFIRLIHSFSKVNKKSSPSLRLGLSHARDYAEFGYYTKIIDELKLTPLYLKLVAPTQFPTNLKNMKKGVQSLFMLDELAELAWNAAVLSIFKDKLTGFLVSKKTYDTALLDGRLDEASSTLDQIEAEYGQSIWLLKSKILILQLTQGLKGQKDFLEQVVNTEFFSVHGALIAYHTSLRSEENVTFADLESELHDMPGDVAWYFTYHLTPGNIDQVLNTAVIQCVEETQPLIDRLLAHISMCALYYSKTENTEDAFSEILKSSSWIPDVVIQNIVQIQSGKPIKVNDAELEVFNRYAAGNYDSEVQKSAELLDVMAYNRAFNIGSVESSSTSMLDEVLELMAKVIVYSNDQIKIRNRLRKIAMVSPSMSLSIGILNFLESSAVASAIHKNGIKNKLALLYGSNANPRSWLALKLDDTANSLAVDLNEHQRDFAVVHLFHCMSMDFEEGETLISKLNLPDYRINTYIGHLAYSNGKAGEAERYYRAALSSEGHFPIDRVKSYLFDSVFAQGKVVEAVRLAVDHCLANPNVVDLYPLEKLSKAALETKALKADMATAILIHLTSRHVHSRWERKLSDIHENVLGKNKVDKPSELSLVDNSFEPRALIYFLRYVCVSRILDDSSAYDSVEGIEEERIAICQLLTALDPVNKPLYASEIKDITRNENIASVWHHFQSSKVYVDEDGLKNYLEASFKETFTRYLILRDSPSLNTQAEKLAKALERIIKDKSFDFKNIKLPASESESLFNTMIQQFIIAFATHPAYGLDTHLSTAVRHGVFEGHIRTALISMLSTRVDDKYVLSSTMQQKLVCNDDAVVAVSTALSRFTRRIENLIEKYLSEHFRISSETYPSGLFSFALTEEVRAEAMNRLITISDYDDFMSELFSLAWQLTDASTQKIKEDIANSLGQQIYQAFDIVLDGLRPNLDDSAFAIMEKEVVETRLRMQKTLEDLAEWFNRPKVSHPEEIDFELVVAVALKQIENCYTNARLIPSVEYAVDKKINGRLLTSLVETLFILLQNIIIHCGITKDLKGVKLNFELDGDSLVITVENPVADSVDLVRLEANIADSLDRYRKGTGLTKAGTEGGSGLSKIWRMMEYEIKKPHRLTLGVEARMFKAGVTIQNMELI